MPDRNILLVVAYDGTGFSGWQRQSRDRSVQGEIEKALARLHGHPVQLLGAGRTDAGVHATGQAASFHTDIASIPVANFVPALNSMLPADVRIVSGTEVDEAFHARFDALWRRYRYVVRPGGFAFPHEARWLWVVPGLPDLAALNRMAASIIGERDFTTFSSPRDQSRTRFRCVYGAAWHPEGENLVFEVSANAFLWRMVRSLVGTMVSFDAKGLGPGAFADALAARDRSRAGQTAPAAGLFLAGVGYPPAGGKRPVPEWMTMQGDDDRAE